MLASALQFRSVAVTDALRQAVQSLQQSHIESASLDARILLQYVLGVSREQLLADTRLTLTSRQYGAFMQLVEKRSGRQPVSQLIGKRDFWNHSFKVTCHTLDPRPDSETLIESVLAHFASRPLPARILDLGTGTGCLLLTLLHEYPLARGVGVDICKSALSVAKENAAAQQIEGRVHFMNGCWAENVEGVFDLIVSNPPYIPTDAIAMLAPEVAQYEPKLALDGGPDGLDCYRAIMAQLPRVLAPQGLAAFEVGIGQAKELESLAAQHGLQVVGIKEDMAGIARCVLVTHNNEKP